MRTESEIQDSINSLRAQLGMEVQSEPIAPTIESDQDVQARIDALNEKLATTPMSRREFMKKRAEDDAKSLKQSSFEFIEGMGEGFSLLAKQGKDAVIEAYQELADGDVSFGNVAKGIGDTVSIGTDDFIMFAKTLGGAAMDKIGGYTEEEEIEREYQRYLRNHDYHTVTREQRLENVENRAMVDFGSNFIDPFMLFPVAKLGSLAVRAPLKAGQKAATAAAFAARSKGAVNLARFAKNVDKGIGKVDKVVDIAGRVGAYPTEMAARIGTQVTRKALKGGAYTLGLGLKGVGKVGSVVEKTASLPRRGIAKLASKVPGAKTAALTGQVVGAASGVPFLLEMGIAEGLGAIAKKVGMGAGELATIFGQRGANKRFLYRLATSDKVSESTRRSAMWAYNHFGTSVGDAAFNMMANGLSLGAINAGLSGLAGEDARTSGSAFGTGALAGGLIPAGQRGMKGGKKDSSREQLGIDQYMKDKLSIDQRNQFRKLPKPAQVLLATLQESGVGAPSLRLLDKKTYLDMLNKEREKAGLPLLDRAPGGHFSQQEGSIYLNSDALKEAGDVGVEIAAHEVGHDFMHKALGNDPAMLELILERYKTTKEKGTAFYFYSDKDGKPMGDPIYLNEEATQFAKDYSRKQKGISIGRDAKKLAQEIGADQFAMNFAQDPNIFNHIHPRLRRHLLDGARRMLSAIGVVEPKTGNPLKSPISKQMNRNPSIRRLYQNYAKMRATELNEKADLAKEGILIQPKAGQNGDARYVELFGGVGLNLKDAKNLVVSNKSLLRELIRMRDQWKEEPSDGWSVRRGQLEGKTLTDDLRTIFTRNDQWGNVANIIDALQQAINQRIGIQFGYRSGTKGKYQNPFRLRDVAIYGWQVGSMGGEGRATLKVLGYDQAVVRANVQTLVEKGYITDPDAFMQQLAEQGQAALQDPEGRINPEGRKENELMTVAFGLKESSGQVASPGLRELLESKAVNKSFRSYDVEALAGLTKSESKAFAFDYPNIRDNYNPFRQSESNLYLPHEVQEGSVSPFRRTSEYNKITDTRTFKNPVYLNDGSRLSGVADNNAQDPFYGYDKNGQMFSIRREFVDPDSIVRSKDNDKTAELIRKELRNKSLFVPDMQPGEIKSLVKVIKDNPDGFTINLQSAWAKRGYVVAPEKRTEEFIDTNNFNLKSLEDYIYKHGDLFDLDGSHLGGWYDTKQDRYTLDVVFPIDNKQEAVEVALWGDQDAIFDLYNFTEIYTKKDGKPIIPEGIEGSLESILQRRPNSNSTFAAEAWRRSQSIREEGSGGVLPRTERAGEEAGGSQATPPEGQVGEDPQFLPSFKKFGASDAVENTSGWLLPNGQFLRAPYSSHEIALARFLDEVPDSNPLKQKIATSPGQTMTLKGLESGLMRVKKDGSTMFFQGRLTPEMNKYIERAGIEHEVKAVHDNSTRGTRDATKTIYEPPTRVGEELQFMPTTERQDYKFKISTRNPTAKSRTEDPVTSDLIVSSNDVLSDPEMTEGYANAIRQYVGITDKGSNATNVIKNFMGFVVDNLLYLYDSVDPEIRKRSKLWYVGARRIAQDYAQQYNTSPQAVAAVIAATSPQTDWYVNVDKARRILETVRDQQETVFDKKMARKHVALAQQKDKAKARKERESYEGKKFKDLNIYGQTAFIRAFDEVYRDRSYQIISPEGKFIGKAMTDKGEVATSSWGSGVEIHKGLRALADDSKANISSTMGEAHKIRNFFNNILLPMSDNESVTIDTHAVAAALLKPLAAKDLEVLNMLGSKPKGEGFASIKNSSIKGIKGLYAIYADAYRQAAKMRGVLPREMQSITWEAVRGLYPKEIKKPKFKEEINSLFQLYESGKISIDELRQKITKKADGIDPPSWFGVEDSPGGNRPRSSKPAKGTKPTADEGELFLPAFRGLGTRDTPRGVRAPSSGVTASGLNRFMLPATARATAVSDTLEAFRN